MDINDNRHQKVLSLILENSGIALSEAELTALSQDTELQSLLDDVLVKIRAKAETSAATTADTENDSEAVAGQPELAIAPSEANDGLPEAESVSEEKIHAMIENTASEDSQQNAISILAEALPTQALEPPSPIEALPQDPVKEQPYQVMLYPEFEPNAGAIPSETDSKPLRPGQVPTGTSNPANSTPQYTQPVAKINIANARAGALFHSEVDISLDNGAKAEVVDVSFTSDIGLTFDRTTSALAGIPTKSGNFEATVTWSYPSSPYCLTKVLFIVNPDPRSLWKIIEPPAGDRYFKQNVDHKLIIGQAANIAAASRRGRSHEHVGSFRDDDFFISSNSDTGWNIMLVADGAGSAKNSRQGSRIVTETVGNHLSTQLNGDKGHNLKQRIISWSLEDQNMVGETFIRQFQYAAAIAVNNIKNESMVAEESVKSYSTTLLAMVSLRIGTELFAASFWMGDGAIAAYGPVGKVRILGTPDSGEYAGQTRFLDADVIHDPEFSKRVSIGKWTNISHLVLMTDGVSDPRFETDNGLQNPQKWDALISEISPCLSDNPQSAEQLAEWLNFFSPGNHDDRTIVVAW